MLNFVFFHSFDSFHLLNCTRNRKHEVQKRDTGTGPGGREPEKEKENPIDEAPLLKETGYRYIMLK